MKEKYLELSIEYIIDVALDVKIKKFKEKFVSLEDCFILKEWMQQRFDRKGLNVKFINEFSADFFIVQNGVIVRKDYTLKSSISDRTIEKLIYDEEFIYLCICQIMINKLNDSIEHTCTTCSNPCLGGITPEDNTNCRRWKHNFNKETKIELEKVLMLK